MPTRERRQRVLYRPIPGWPWFRVSTEGVVESCRARGSGGYLSAEWRRLDAHINEDGYEEVHLSADGIEVTARVHTLVLLAFVGPKPAGMQACHGDGNRRNNRLDNLRWDTHQANIDDRERHGNTARGERNGNAKITQDTVALIRELRELGASLQKIGHRVGLSKRQVGRIIRGSHWRPARMSLEEYDRTHYNGCSICRDPNCDNPGGKH